SVQMGDDFPAWRLRNSNEQVLRSLARSMPFVADLHACSPADDAGALAAALRDAVAQADVVVLTGGVSKGEYDFVRDAVLEVGGEVLFHGVTARPGRPTLGAVVGDVPVLGLPGNPVAVLTTSRRLLTPVLRRRAGVERFDPPAPLASIDEWRGKTLPLTWWRPVTLVGPGVATLASLKGSGDVCGPATTDGFIEAPPDANHTGPFPFFPWTP
ncbi:MAG: molybdopterin-binding protein, partial [Planctomycetota bacterium]